MPQHAKTTFHTICVVVTLAVLTALTLAVEMRTSPNEGSTTTSCAYTPESPTPRRYSSGSCAIHPASLMDIPVATTRSPELRLGIRPRLRKSTSVDSFIWLNKIVSSGRGPAIVVPFFANSEDVPPGLDSGLIVSPRSNQNSVFRAPHSNEVISDDFVPEPWLTDSREGEEKHLPGRHLPLGDLLLPPRVSPQSSNSSLAPFGDTVNSVPLPFYRAPPVGAIRFTRSRDLNASFNEEILSGIEEQQDRLSSFSQLSIAVVGARGCGKSAVIQEDARVYGDSKINSRVIPLGTLYQYDRRLDWLASGDTISSISLVVIEIDITKLHHVPQADGIFVCYDVSNEDSFAPIAQFLRILRLQKLPAVGLACKSDLYAAVRPQLASELFQEYDMGLIEVTSVLDTWKSKIGKSFNWLLKSILHAQDISCFDSPKLEIRNPASPENLFSLPHNDSLLAMPSMTGVVEIDASDKTSTPPLFAQVLSYHMTSPNSFVDSSPIFGLPPHSIHEDITQPVAWSSDGVRPEIETVGYNRSLGLDLRSQNAADRHSRPVQYATLEELLDKLLFLAVSGDDPTYISNFLLTYRRFATPRSALLAMQKRMRDLDISTNDPMFVCYAQMRICHLLETWIQSYPHDFAVPGAFGALNALVKSIIAKTYLLHYGNDFLPFLERAASLVDKDASWAHKYQDLAEDNDDPYSPFGDEDEGVQNPIQSVVTSTTSISVCRDLSSQPYIMRERKFSLPLTSKFTMASILSPNAQHDNHDTSTRHLLKELVKMSGDIQNMESTDIAQEITRIEVAAFMSIEPRDWLHYALVAGKKLSDVDTVSTFNAISNHLADWVVSLILCHDKPRQRARQIEKFVDIAHKLRAINNYSALRAFVAGINNSTFHGDDTMEIFKTRYPEHFKNLLSWDVLLQHRGAHQAYRMALRNTKGACIPALEVHMSDLIRAQEGNPDYHPSNLKHIHWGKFNMFGKFIQSTMQCQMQCGTSKDYNFPERPRINALVFNDLLMTHEVQMSRMAPLPEGDEVRINTSRFVSGDNSFTLQREAPFIRRIFQW